MRFDLDVLNDVLWRRARPGDDPPLTEPELGQRQRERGVVDVEGYQQRVVIVAGLVDVLSVRHPQRRGFRGVQPRMTAAQADQVLV